MRNIYFEKYCQFSPNFSSPPRNVMDYTNNDGNIKYGEDYRLADSEFIRGYCWSNLRDYEIDEKGLIINFTEVNILCKIII